MGDAGGFLFDDRTFIEVRGDIVGRGADQLDAALMGLVIGLGPLERGQERMVDVDDPAIEAGRELVGQDLHVAGQHHEISAGLLDQPEQLFLLLGL